MSFRWRLTLTYAALLAVTLLIAGAFSFAALRHTLYDGLDASLRTYAQKQAQIEATGGGEPPSGVEAALGQLNRQQPTRLTVYDLQGREVDCGPSRVGFLPQAGAVQVGSERVFTVRIPEGWIQASQSDAALRASLGQILRLELLGLPLLLLLTLGIGYVLADRALRPVDQVSDLAARIARSGQPGERVPVSPGADELARLTRTINDMLDKLDAQMARERLFAHASAHELRTPISVIRAAASLALEHGRTPEQYREVLAQVREVSEDMSGLTHRLLALARAGRPAEQHAVNLADVALMAAELHTPEVQERGTRLQVTLEDAAACGDFDALVLAAGNLIQNAVRYSPPGSCVLVSCRVDATHACLSVQDAGPGIPADELPRLLQPFQRGPQQGGSGGGAGLGLALVEAIAEAHGGKLMLLTSPGGGLRAELILSRNT
ncbi:sensor histidine kinase [Deinococcus radiopugnans]|uniref:histidine kinase n=1 Tax=Deinococcus radiopugnans ATCC 19172 TaxID=585398 RepID=A0A5C4Y5F3_9DEIO|nr:HAMP domain-containing sensor histidine kinase [Deinococcus radiopugnans]MBB6017095.1 signal transduction histidine kinase [Deinococcus radiopugnans ATCC 19172]TNM70674.1 HAMP domain-containing histidine kinase [Deinococcus radiopugnans ATCC 19172]